METKYVVAISVAAFLVTTVPAFYIHAISGVVRNFPELGFTFESRVIKSNLLTSNRNECIKYIDDINALIKDFSSEDKLRVLVIGNSFGRDVSNILLEYDSQKVLEVRYFQVANIDQPALKRRLMDADWIILAAKEMIHKEFLVEIEQKHDLTIDPAKVWVFGTKDFGYHNGPHHFRYASITDFRTYRTRMKEGVSEVNDKLRKAWGNHFVDLIYEVTDGNGNVLVYTPEGKLLSHDTLHLTKSGAVFFARKLQARLNGILGQTIRNRTMSEN